MAVDFAPGLKTVTLSVGAGWYAAADQDPDAGALRAAMGLAGPAPEFSHDDYFSLYFKRSDTPPGSYPKWTDFRFTSSDGGTLWGLTGFPASSSSDFFIQGKSGMRLQALEAGSAVSLTAGGVTVARFVAEGVAAGADNGRSLGTPTMRFSTVYAGSGSISTSDEAEKKYVGAIPPRWLDAWGDVGWRRFKFRASKGVRGGRRWHIGLIAQRVHGAFEARGIDAFAIGLLCRDAIAGDAGAGHRDGERWGLRYAECLALEAAWQRRAIARIEQRMERRIEARLAAIEAAVKTGAA